MSTMRLDKYLANSGAGTRTEVKALIKKGMIAVNGETAIKPDCKVDPQSDHVTCCGKACSYQKYEYYMFHKPAGCVTATWDNLHVTVMDYISSDKKEELFPVGRLDIDTEGLLLITNDGVLAHGLLSPKKHVEKTYFARIKGKVGQEEQTAFLAGVDIGDEKPALPAKLSLLQGGGVSEVLVTVCEGRFHLVKRMFEAVGKEVIYLKRISMGGLTLDENLEKGHYRPLTKEEVEKIGGSGC